MLKLPADFVAEPTPRYSTRLVTRAYRLIMAMFDTRPRRSAGDDWKHDHWLAHTGFGLFIAGLVVWLIVLYDGAPFVF